MPNLRLTPAALTRRMPDIRELASLVRFVKPSTDLRGARLAKAQTVWELREIAKGRTPQAPFDYVDGAAELEISLHRSRLSYRNVEFVPRVLHDVAVADASTPQFGTRYAMPLGIAPPGFMRLVGVNTLDQLNPSHVNLMTPQPASGVWI